MIRQALHKNSTLVILILTATLIPFLGLMSGHHVFLGFDDAVNIVNNDRIKALTWDNVKWMFTGNKLGVYEPLSWLLKATSIQTFGLSPRVVHLTSVFVHLCNVLMFFICARIMFRTVLPSVAQRNLEYAAAAAALLWGISPLRVEVVAWASGQSYAVGAFFSLVSLFFYLRFSQSRRESTPRYGFLTAAVIAYIFAIFGKSAMVMLPAWFLVLDLTVYSRRDVFRLLLEKVPFGIIALLTIVVITVVNDQAMGTSHVILPWAEKLGSAVLALFIYPIQSAFPVNLTPSHAIPHWGVAILSPLPLLALLTFCALVCVSLRVAKHNPWPLAILVSYVLFLVPVLGFVQHGNPILSGDRYAYVSTIPLYLGLAAYLLSQASWWQAGRWAVTVFVLITVTLMALTKLQVTHWKSDVALWQHAIKVQPYNAFALNNLGFNYWSAKDYKLARRYLERAYNFNPQNHFPMMNLGVTYYELNRCDLAVEHYLEAAKSHHQHNDGLYNNLGNCYVRLRDYESSVPAFEHALKLNPRHSKASASLARVRAHLEKSK